MHLFQRSLGCLHAWVKWHYLLITWVMPSDRCMTLGNAEPVTGGRHTGTELVSLSYKKMRKGWSDSSSNTKDSKRANEEEWSEKPNQSVFRRIRPKNENIWGSLTTILERTALMCVSCLSSLSSGSSSSKRTWAFLNRDFLGGAGVREGSSSGKSLRRKDKFFSWSHTPCLSFKNYNLFWRQQLLVISSSGLRASRIRLPSMVTTSLCWSSSFSGSPVPCSPRRLSGRRTTLTTDGETPADRNRSCSRRRSSSESVGLGRRNIPPFWYNKGQQIP